MAHEIETLTFGYGLIEGPRCDGEGNLYFSDVPNGGVYRRSPDGAVELAVPKRKGVGGMVLHARGGLVLSGKNICHNQPDGTVRVLLALDDAPGFNDITTDAQGRVYAGSMKSNPFDDMSWKNRVPGDCWRIEGEGKATKMYGGIKLTNGIGFSPDGARIYHADTAQNGVVVHDVAADGSMGNERFLAQGDDLWPDGLAVDDDDTVWVADFKGGCVRAFDQAGREQARITVPATEVTSLCFGGADRRDLYIVTADNSDDPSRKGTVFRTRVDTPGLIAPLATI
ncbi:MAG: SMP-30/gluconolactonase/LRE family protein [Acidimicrobiales bacterium]